MNREFILISIVILIIFVFVLFYFLYKQQSFEENTDNPKTESQDEILLELKKLNITGVEKTKEIELRLPEILSDDNWGVKELICKDGGYNLSDYAGKNVLLTRYSTNEIYDKTEPLDVWIIKDKDKIVCVYKTVKEGSNMAPGVFSVKENPLIKKK